MIQTISVNDIFDELRAENTRLSDELLFANKCVHILLKFKCYLFNNINGNCAENELKELENEFNALLKEKNTKISEELVENVVNINGIQTNELTKASKLSLKDKYLIDNRRKKNKASKARLKFDTIDCNHSNKSKKSKSKVERDKHFGVNPFICTINGCDKRFISKRNLRNHLNFVHELKKTIACKEANCKAMFKNNSSLNTHMKTHLTPHSLRPFACDVEGCSFRTLNKSSLNVHKFIHSDQRLFKCRECGKAFKLESTMKTHLLIHNTEPQYKCDWPHCSVAYRCWKSLNRHKLKHENIDTHVYCCDWPGCDYRSDRKDILSVHRIIHTDERNYPCNWPSCDRRLRSKKDLREHLMIHMNDKRHKCQWPGCDYSCVQSGNLKKHYKTHCKVTP